MSNFYFEVKNYIDKDGRMIKEHNPINTGDEKIPVMYNGIAIIQMSTGNPNVPPMKQPFEFMFPDTVKTVEQAFKKFDEIVNIALEEQKKKMEEENGRRKKKMEEERRKQGKQIIMPGNNIPAPPEHHGFVKMPKK